MTGETPDVRFDKRKPREHRQNLRYHRYHGSHRQIKKRREKARKGEKKREEESKREEKMSRVNYYQSAFNSQKEKLNILAEMLEISKSIHHFNTFTFVSWVILPFE